MEEPQHLEATKQTGTEEIEVDVEDMELGELDLEGIEKACANPKTGYITFSHIALLKEALIKTKGVRGLRVVSDSMNRGEGKCRGRQINSQRIQDVGGKLVASGQYSMIDEAFKLLNNVNQ